MPRHRVLVAALLALTALLAAACGGSSGGSGKIQIVAAENEYANVASQIGGQYVTVSGIMSNPNTDPHTFEASAKVAQEVANARITIQNGVAYDDFMTQIAKSSPNPSRISINVQHLLGLPDSTPNPHLWYKPTTMPAVAKKLARDLGSIDPSHRSYFDDRVTTFDHSLGPWMAAIQKLKGAHQTAPVATTEPVADYLVQAAGLDNKTPWELQADIMNGVDLSPQDVTLQENLFREHQVKAFLYNQQVTDSVTETFLSVAQQNSIPVVGVYETMPLDYSYQNWMVAETNAIYRALSDGQSTTKLS